MGLTAGGKRERAGICWVIQCPQAQVTRPLAQDEVTIFPLAVARGYPGQNRRRTPCLIIVLVVAWTVAFGIGAIFLCKGHPSYAWAPVAVVAEKCSAQLPFLEGYAISDFIMDVLIWALPHPKVSMADDSDKNSGYADYKQIWALHMNFERKLAITAVFFVGLLYVLCTPSLHVWLTGE